MTEYTGEKMKLKDNEKMLKIRRWAYYILMIAIVTGFLVAEAIFPSERTGMSLESNILYRGSVFWEKSDGTRQEITVPGKYDVPVGETMVLVTRLPDNYNENAIGLRSSLQDIRFYLDGELRCEYTTKDTRPFGKNSASRYVFCETSEKDAGKELKIELTTYTSNYSGVVNAIYYGDKGDIWTHIFHKYGFETGIAFFVLFAGIVTIIFSIALGIVYKTKFDMEYLGWCMLMGAMWMLGESKVRQLWISNASILAALCFVVILLCPVPILFYVDCLQKRRYTRIYHYIEGFATLNFLVCTFLQFTGKADYIQTLPAGQLLMAVTFATVVATFVMDIRQGKSKDYALVLFGILVAMSAILIEMVSVYYVVMVSGVFIGIGLIVLLFVNIIQTMKKVREIERDRQREEAQKLKRQTEKMSLQMIQTLSMTIEAKDEYTNGHSYRVAQYAALIAEELGWNQKDIRNLKNAAYLHDVGKVGIPDTVLNKPSRLTEEEFALIKTHTVIGAGILKDITMIEHVAEVARYHHERYDGTGYPDGLVGEEIPVQARIVAVADSYDAMNSRRIYRDALPEEEIYQEMKRNRGTQFDPAIVDVFLKLLDEKKVVIQKKALEWEEFTDLEKETGKFISDIMNTMKSQESTDSYDYLTGLPMRSRGETQIARMMKEHAGCLVFLDMDNLKKINDIYGHKAGDRALKLLGNLISRISENAIACRFGGDEFILFLPDMETEVAAVEMEKLFARFAKEKEADREICCAALSAGLCMTEKEDSFEGCYMNADKALYYVKQNGKSRFLFYHEMQEQDRMSLASGKDLKKVALALRQSGSYTGALDVDSRGFAKIFEYVNSLGARYKYTCYLVMVTMDTPPEQTMYMEHIEQALECMEQAIHQKIRKVDICTRYSAMQYLIILFEPEESQIPKVMERIFMQYYALTDQKEFRPRYEYIPMSEKTEEREFHS